MSSGSRVPAGVTVNRAPVLTLWAAVVAERLGFDREEALTLGKAVAGLNAQAKGRRLGLFAPSAGAEMERKPKAVKVGETLQVPLLGRMVQAARTAEGVRALDKGRPLTAESVERYLESKFGEALAAVRAAMARLVKSRKADELAAEAFSLYERFRPTVPRGTRGWGAAGVLDLGRIRELAEGA